MLFDIKPTTDPELKMTEILLRTVQQRGDSFANFSYLSIAIFLTMVDMFGREHAEEEFRLLIREAQKNHLIKYEKIKGKTKHWRIRFTPPA